MSVYCSHKCVGCQLHVTGKARAGVDRVGKDGQYPGSGSGTQEEESGLEREERGERKRRRERAGGGWDLKQEKGKTVTVSSIHAS